MYAPAPYRPAPQHLSGCGCGLAENDASDGVPDEEFDVPDWVILPLLTTAVTLIYHWWVYTK